MGAWPCGAGNTLDPDSDEPLFSGRVADRQPAREGLAVATGLLDGRVAIVTGGAGNLGAPISRLFAS